MNLQITEIRIRLVRASRHGVVASAAVTVDDALAIHDILVVRREDRLFVVMPGRTCPDGLHRDLVHPIRQDVRAELMSAVLSAYHREEQRNRQKTIYS